MSGKISTSMLFQLQSVKFPHHSISKVFAQLSLKLALISLLVLQIDRVVKLMGDLLCRQLTTQLTTEILFAQLLLQPSCSFWRSFLQRKLGKQASGMAWNNT
ncbi:hypothetical protein [Nostoc sp. PCC 7524]|uniref:hypothetical protein n=1 Tax=Nostoc sp. (strain ATCC 29411 / PCC 7524) TaxID=28072 RepID=UPI0011819457|nr:hypothetical protein [Nostoc sp. PCC 7524]